MKKLFIAFALVITTLAARAEPIDMSKYVLFWGDEFDTMSLGDALPRNGKNWYTQQFWGGGFGSATFKPSTGDVWAIGPKGDATSALEIKLRRDTTNGSMRSGIISAMWPDGTTASGETSSRDSYYEARMWLPDPIPGVWPAFWGVEQEYLPSFTGAKSALELDIIEQYGALPFGYTVVPHVWNFSPASESSTRTFHNPVSLHGAWHTYGIAISATGEQTYYFDGQSFLYFGSRTSSWGSNYDTLLNTPIGWMFDLAAGGGWPIDPELGLSKPASLWIDYFREYKLRVDFTTAFVGTPGDDISVIPGITRTGASGGMTINATAGADANSTALSGIIYTLPTTNSLAQFIKAPIKAGGSVGPLIALRCQDEANWIGLRWSATTFNLVQKVAGTATLIGAGASGLTMVDGDEVRLEIDAAGNARALLNGVQKIAPTAVTATGAMTPCLIPRTGAKVPFIFGATSGAN